MNKPTSRNRRKAPHQRGSRHKVLHKPFKGDMQAGRIATPKVSPWGWDDLWSPAETAALRVPATIAVWEYDRHEGYAERQAAEAIRFLFPERQRLRWCWNCTAQPAKAALSDYRGDMPQICLSCCLRGATS